MREASATSDELPRSGSSGDFKRPGGTTPLSLSRLVSRFTCSFPGGEPPVLLTSPPPSGGYLTLFCRFYAGAAHRVATRDTPRGLKPCGFFGWRRLRRRPPSHFRRVRAATLPRERMMILRCCRPDMPRLSGVVLAQEIDRAQPVSMPDKPAPALLIIWVLGIQPHPARLPSVPHFWEPTIPLASNRAEIG